ncbi:MAG TPA: F0F1 ATP synthase subunit gamma [Methylocystis sp.]|nr:F0F1 ATP synthase subunit gamma [Methylocystis sp.]
MSERLSDIRAHIVATRQLESVIAAMRGVAAARTREAQLRLEGVRAYAKALGESIGSALALMTEHPSRQSDAARRSPGGRIVLVFCSAQGFVGPFNDRILAAAKRAVTRSSAERAALYIVGERGEALAEEQGLQSSWTAPMASRVDEAPLLADRIAGALYQRLDENQAARVTLIHGAPGSAGAKIVERSLVPLDLARFPLARRPTSPLITLPPETLIESLAQEYVFAELCEAAVLSFAAENEARMQAMIAARSNVQKSLEELEARHRQKRQEEITEEIIELVRPSPRRQAQGVK